MNYIITLWLFTKDTHFTFNYILNLHDPGHELSIMEEKIGDSSC